ncbi:unnamed protein product [Cylicocyclus nassatus]|uniref:C-type lectin domain-containing protein n=1 Tax=Cylicocyclus nassatus TaxID=53992 RepID=A0AA36GZY4_CYLNA|nr:unnamed protein product [Cylicocyclus nassatus]
MNLLLLLLPLAGAYISPNNNKQIFRSSNQSPFPAFLNKCNAACPGHCEDGWAYFSDTDACYKNFFDANYNDAEHLCNILGGHLASIHTYKENYFVAELAKMGRVISDIHDMTWIGLREGPEKDKWIWTDGTKLDFTVWASNSPDRKWKEGKRCVLV